MNVPRALWHEEYGDLIGAEYIVFLIDDELCGIENTASKRHGPGDVKALAKLKGALLREREQDPAMAVVLVGPPVEETTALDVDVTVPETDRRWDELCDLLKVAGPRGIVISDVMYTVGNNRRYDFFHHVLNLTAQFCDSENVAAITKNDKYARDTNSKCFVKQDTEGFVTEVVDWVRERSSKYHECHTISRVISEFVRKRTGKWTHNSLNSLVKAGSLSVLGTTFRKKNDDSAKALFMLTDTGRICSAKWQDGFLKTEYCVEDNILRGMVDALRFPSPIQWPIQNKGDNLWTLPCVPGIVFLLSLRACVEAIKNQQAKSGKPAPGAPTSIEFFLQEFHGGHYVTGVKLTLHAADPEKEKPAEILVARMYEKHDRGGWDSLSGHGVSSALYSLLFCHVEGVKADKLSPDWRKVFAGESANGSRPFVQPRQLLSYHAEGAVLTVFWTCVHTSGGHPLKYDDTAD